MKHLKDIQSLFEDKFVPGGWVNVKIDKDLPIRISRYVKSLDKILGRKYKGNLHEKIKALSNIDDIINREDISIQSKVSIITILQYLKEIKTQFNASSAGFLLESFLAALIHGKLEETGTGIADIYRSLSDEESRIYDVNRAGVSNKLSYQIKFYKENKNIKVNMGKNCDYYIIILKTGENVSVDILTSNKDDKNSFIGDYSTKIKGTSKFTRNDYVGKPPDKNYLYISSSLLKNHKFKVTLQLDDIDNKILSIGDKIKKSIERIYKSISNIHYSVDSLIIGVDKRNNPIDIEDAHQRVNTDIDKLAANIEKFRERYDESSS